MNKRLQTGLAIGTCIALVACISDRPEGLALSQSAPTTVKMDFFHRPLPEIPLPNDIATRHDRTSPTGRRINASMLAPTGMERRIRKLIDTLDGFGTFQPIVIPFTGPLDVNSVIAGHRDADFDTSNDVVYLVNIDPNSSKQGEIMPLDFGGGSYPIIIERLNQYWKNDPRTETLSMSFEEFDEDVNGNGVLDLGEDLNGNGVMDPGEDLDDDGILDPPEDTDADGTLDRPNYLPGANPPWNDLAARADALMSFYEKETNTLIARTMEPLDERTRYAVVVTRRVLDEAGQPVGSPYKWVNHGAQTEELRPLLDHMPDGITTDDVAFAFSFTTQSIQSNWMPVRDGLYGHGIHASLGEEYPAELAELLPVRDEGLHPGMSNPFIVYGENWVEAFEDLADRFDLASLGSREYEILNDSFKYIDYYAIGRYESPQLYERYDEDGNWLPLDEQSWPPDIDRTELNPRPEDIFFTLSVPRKEISARADGEPAPVVIISHGYTGNRFDGVLFSGYFAQFGLATLAIDGPSHGLATDDLSAETVKTVLEEYGLRSMGTALLKDRAINQDNDPVGEKDSGADFWTAYLFHTRDVVRQYAVDYTQLIRIFRGFDGANTWNFDVTGDGVPDLAGDFDGDGAVDVGGPGKIHMLGGSLGGIMSMVMGGLEPHLNTIVPLAGGGGYADMGNRSTQGGAIEGFILRAMAPLITGTTETDGSFHVEMIVPDLNRDGVLTIARVDGVKPWDTLVVSNLVNGERGCAFVQPDGLLRTSVESDEGDELLIEIFDGPQLAGTPECDVREGAVPRLLIDTWQVNEFFQFTELGQAIEYPAGSPLVSVAEGLGLKRAHPDLRRFQGLGQMVLDPGDPINFARGLGAEPLTYESTGETTGVNALIVTTLGDTAVPASTGAAFGRAAGFVDYRNNDPRYGKPVNQVLIDTYVMEGVHTLDRYVNATTGGGVHLDVENFSQGTDTYGTDIPRLDPPLRLPYAANPENPEGISGSIFPLPRPEGQHVFDVPGYWTDRARRQCSNECALPGMGDPCGCDTLQAFDLGAFMFGMLAQYIVSSGTYLSDDLCQSSATCGTEFAIPPARDTATLR